MKLEGESEFVQCKDHPKTFAPIVPPPPPPAPKPSAEEAKKEVEAKEKAPAKDPKDIKWQYLDDDGTPPPSPHARAHPHVRRPASRARRPQRHGRNTHATITPLQAPPKGPSRTTR